MKKGTYYLLIACVIATLVFVVGFGIALGNPVIPGILILAGVGLIYLCRKRVTDVMDDDLSDTIYGKAAVNALILTIIIAAIVFAGTTAFSLSAGYGGGFHSYDNGSVRVTFMQFGTVPGHALYEKSYMIQNSSDPTGEDYLAVQDLFQNGDRVREVPLIFGIAMAFTVLLLAGLYAAFTLYYTRKYTPEKQ
jgi:uncharacterized membrane protein